MTRVTDNPRVRYGTDKTGCTRFSKGARDTYVERGGGVLARQNDGGCLRAPRGPGQAPQNPSSASGTRLQGQGEDGGGARCRLGIRRCNGGRGEDLWHLPLRRRPVDPRPDRQLRPLLLLHLHHGVGQGRVPLPHVQAALPINSTPASAGDLPFRAGGRGSSSRSGELGFLNPYIYLFIYVYFRAWALIFFTS